VTPVDEALDEIAVEIAVIQQLLLAIIASNTGTDRMLVDLLGQLLDARAAQRFLHEARQRQ
jgi:hypothetical protein